MKKRNQKRWLAILLCWMMMLTNISIPALAEETTETPSCEHSETVSLEEAGAAATCSADGSHIVIIVCADCGQELSRNAVTDAALGHDYIETARTEATYDSEGSVTYTCSRCEDSYQETLPKLERPSVPFEQTETVDGAKITVKAAAGVFDADTRLNISKTGNSDFTGAAENALGIRAGERIIISHTVYSISGAEMNGSAQAKLENLKLTDLQQAYPVGTVSVYVLRHDANAQRAADQARRISAEVNLGGNSVSFDLSEPGLYDVVTVVRLPERTEETTPIINEEPAEESAEEPIDESKKEMTGAPAEEPAEESGEESAEEPAEETGEETAEESAEELSEESAEESGEESAEEPAEESGEESDEEPAEEPDEESTEEPAEESGEESAEEPKEESGEESAEEPKEESGEESAEEPAEESGEESTEEPAEEPDEESTEEPAEESGEEFAEEPKEESVEESDEEPAEEPDEESTEEPAEESGEESAEEPAEESGEESAEETAGLTEESEPETEDEPLAVTISAFYEGELRYGSTVTLTAVLSVDDPEAVVTWEYSPDGGLTVFAVEDEYGSTLTYTYSEDTRNYSWRAVVNRTPAE